MNKNLSTKQKEELSVTPEEGISGLLRDFEAAKNGEKQSELKAIYPQTFELVQVHECCGHAETVIRRKDKVYAGNLQMVANPKAYMPPK